MRWSRESWTRSTASIHGKLARPLVIATLALAVMAGIVPAAAGAESSAPRPAATSAVILRMPDLVIAGVTFVRDHRTGQQFMDVVVRSAGNRGAGTFNVRHWNGFTLRVAGLDASARIMLR